MRLLRLHLGDYHVLHDLKIEFEPVERARQAERPYSLDFLVGVNGSGKSTVLRALADIFQGLSGEQQAIKFAFEIEYWLEERSVRIAARNTHPETDALLDGFLVSKSDSLTDEMPAFDPEQLIDVLTPEQLPARVIAYTTGAEADWTSTDIRSVFNTSNSDVLPESAEERALRELPEQHIRSTAAEKVPSTIFRLVPKDDMSTVALCGLLVNAAETDTLNRPLKNVFAEAKINSVTGFALRFDISAATFAEQQAIQNRLARFAMRKNRNGGEVRLLFRLGDFATNLKDEFGSGLALYEFLSDLAISSDKKRPVFRGASLFIERHRENGQIPPLHTWDWLSDGERSFLGRMCLFLLFGETDALILLDEPEVHFNDYWKRHIVSLLHSVLTQKEATRKNACHLLIATHSSIALTDVHRDDIILLVREGLKTSGPSYTPNFQTFGADPSDIMVHVFGTQFANGERSVSYIREKIGQSSREQLVDLQNEVAPGYWYYRIQLEIDQFGKQD